MSISITANGTSSGSQVTSTATCLMCRGTLAGAKVLVEYSSNNTNYGPAFLITEPGTFIISLPANWYYRCTTWDASSATSATIEVA